MHINRDGNLHSENVVENIVHYLNVLAKMIGLMIHNLENMTLEAVWAQHHTRYAMLLLSED